MNLDKISNMVMKSTILIQHGFKYLNYRFKSIMNKMTLIRKNKISKFSFTV